MNRKHFFVGLGCVLLLVGIAGWVVLSIRPQAHDISISLVGYTNVPTAFSVAACTSSNATTGRFAIFRVHNPTRQNLFGYFGPMILKPNDGPTLPSIQMQNSLNGDFNLPPHGTTLVAVPEPQVTGKWQFMVTLHPIYIHSYRWQGVLAEVGEKVGFGPLALSSKNRFAVSEEIER